MVKRTKPRHTVMTCKRDLMAAKDEAIQLETLEMDQISTLALHVGELKLLETGRGDRVLTAIRKGDGRDAAISESQVIAGKQVQISTLDDVLVALKVKREEIERVVAERKVACLLVEADELDRQVEERQTHTDELLAQLYEWEGVEYAVAPSPPPESGVAVPGKTPRFGARASILGDPVPTSSPDTGGLSIATETRFVSVSITEGMRRKAKFYRVAAEALKTGAPIPTSIVTGKLDFPLPEYI